MNFLNNIQRRLTFIKIMANSDQKNIDQLFARVFSSEEGQKILAYLHHITTCRIAPPNASEEQLRHMEGQRALLKTIENLSTRGRTQ